MQELHAISCKKYTYSLFSTKTDTLRFLPLSFRHLFAAVALLVTCFQSGMIPSSTSRLSKEIFFPHKSQFLNESITESSDELRA